MPRKKKSVAGIFDMPFPSRLRELLSEQGLSHQTLAPVLGVARQSIGAYCDGSSSPSFENLIKIAQYFSVSTDYLLGLSEIRSIEKSQGRVYDELRAANRDIAALLWLNGDCEYCAYGRKKEYSGAVRWECGLEPGTECAPEWRGVEMIDES